MQNYIVILKNSQLDEEVNCTKPFLSGNDPCTISYIKAFFVIQRSQCLVQELLQDLSIVSSPGLASTGSIVVERSPHDPNVEGSNMASASSRRN